MRLSVVVAACASMLAASAVRAGPPVYIPPPPPPPPKPVEQAPPKPEKARLLVMDLKSSDVDKATVSVLQGIVTTGLSEYPELDVVSGEDVKQLVQLSAERETMGCSEDAGCLAEIADALGAKLVVFGTVGKLDNSLVLNLNLFDSVKATGLGRIVVQADNTKSIPKKLKPKLRDLVGKWYAEHHLTLPPVVEEKEEPPAPVAQVVDPGPWPWVTTGAGAVLLVAGSAAAVVGALPYQRFLDDKAKAASLEQKIETHGTVNTADVTLAKSISSDILAARTDWNNYGYLAFDVGAPAAAAGVALTVAGVVWVVTAPHPGGAE